MSQALRMLVRGFYDIQKLRIQTGARVTANIKAKLGARPGTKDEESLDKEVRTVLDKLTRSYDRLTDALATGTIREFLESLKIAPGLISDEAELALIGSYKRLLDEEARLAAAVEKEVKKHPLWNAFLKHVRGVGPLMAGVLITTLDPAKAPHPSSFWYVAGLDVAPDGRGRGRYKEHLVLREYVDRKGQKNTKLSLTFNPWLKSKLMGVLAEVFIKSKSQYKTVYDNYKHRLLTHPDHKDKRRAHIDMMARRYMVKIFLKDLWLVWRQIEGLPIKPPYCVEKMGLDYHPPLVAPQPVTAGGVPA